MAEWSYRLGDVTIKQDEFSHWWLMYGGSTYNSRRPQPLLSKALTEGWWTLEQVKEVKNQLGLE